MAEILTSLALILVVTFAFSELFFFIRYPRVIGQILAGMLLGLPFFALFIRGVQPDIAFLSDLGIVFLLLLTDMQLNLPKFRQAERDSIVIAIFCVLMPAVLGFLLMTFMGYSVLVGLVVGAAIALTAEGTKLKVLLELRALNTKVGTIMLGAGIIDDIFEILFLSLLLFFVSGDLSGLFFFPVKILVFALLAYLTYRLFPLGLHLVQKERNRISTFSFILVFGLLIAVLSSRFGIGPIIGAFVAGIIINMAENHRAEHHELVKELEVMTFSLIIPFFFINIGLHFDFFGLLRNWPMTLLVLGVAIAGKVGGAIAATPFTDLTIKQTHLIGWGMNSRGSVELVLAELARSYGLLTPEVYSAIVAMSIITTLMFPFVLRTLIHQDRKILQ